MIKASSILHKAQAMNARPAELLETAIRNLKTGAKQLMPTRNEDEEPSSGTDLLSLSKEMLLVVSDVMFNFFRIFFLNLKTGLVQEVHMPARIPVNRAMDQPKPANRELLSEWKIPTFVSRHVSPEVRYSLISCKYLLTVFGQRNVAHSYKLE